MVYAFWNAAIWWRRSIRGMSTWSCWKRLLIRGGQSGAISFCCPSLTRSALVGFAVTRMHSGALLFIPCLPSWKVQARQMWATVSVGSPFILHIFMEKKLIAFILHVTLLWGEAIQSGAH